MIRPDTPHGSARWRTGFPRRASSRSRPSASSRSMARVWSAADSNAPWEAGSSDAQSLLPPRLVEERRAAVRRHVIGRAPGDGRVGQEPDAVRQARAADVERGAQRGRLEEPGSALDRDDRAVQHRFARECRSDEPDGLRRAELRDVRQRVGLHVDGARRLQRLQLDPRHKRRLRRVLAARRRRSHRPGSAARGSHRSCVQGPQT